MDGHYVGRELLGSPSPTRCIGCVGKLSREITDWMGQTNTRSADGKKQAAEEEVLLVRPEGAESVRVLPLYERQAGEIYASCMQRIRVIPPLLQTSVGLPINCQHTEPKLLHTARGLLSSLVTSRVSLMEREALEQQQKRKRKEEGVLETNADRLAGPSECTRNPLGEKLEEFAISCQTLQANAAQKVALEARAIDAALAGVSERLDVLHVKASEQNILAELYESAGRETRALHEEVEAVTTLLQSNVLILLHEICSLLSDAERDGLNADVNARMNLHT